MTVHTTVDNGILTITLDRPKANAIDVPTSRALHAAFARLHDDASLRVAVVTAAGERFFSAGWDLNGAVNGEAIDADHGPGGFAGLTEFFALDKPVIAAVNGLAIGGGFELALAADLIVAAEHAEFALPEVLRGMVADSGGVLRLPRRLPRAIAMELLLTGRRLGAAEALAHGLVNQVVDGSQLLDAAMSTARAIVAAAPLAVRAIKEVMRATEEQDLAAAYRTMRSGSPAYREMLVSQDAQEGPRAFVEKRAPVWRGR
ncbi:crotonobetainyl-CoA hydratase [Aquincola sp. S2]|uniref:Crotonobetainyl-CoA hydratase n=1 Tax=Pseudaquabacterium terrae TaxID=2732868 RepID=A0ABX2EUA1_9BURK|nr:enoyl-CoA hydratase-related protein [Aquabacterium terrae]NRF72315.1 crotonobetainyl-CoA hydratase [Aquabacterium terrae]